MKSCLEFDYPRDRYEIIVADDSSDKTSRLLDSLHKRTGGAFRIVRRQSRQGYKAGALNEALKRSSGDIIVVFDSDYVLDKNFLREIVKPFSSPNVGFVQTRWEYLNAGKNWVSRLAMTAYAAFHQCSMPIKEKIGTAIFCGTGGAIRKSLLAEAGGWNENSIAEDLDITVKILRNGHRMAYLPHVKARGEVPSTLNSFVRQQQRWAYGTTKIMKDELGKIFRSKKLSKKQKFDMFFLTSGFIVFPFILGVTVSTMFVMSAWFGPNTTGIFFDIENIIESAGLALNDFFSFEGIAILALSSGYIFECIVALIKQKTYRDLTVIPYIFAVGLIMQITNTVAVLKAILGIKHAFYKTPKMSYRGG